MNKQIRFTEESPSGKKIKPICATCGSDDVVCDAIVWWRQDLQEWAISGLLDDTSCNKCEEECDLEWEDLP